MDPIEPDNTDFGFEQVSPQEKTQKVRSVFDRVAGHYDLMNDLMSFGLHRLWKSQAIRELNPKAGDWILDLASGTGDLNLRLAHLVGKEGFVIASDINANMLSINRDRLLDKGFVGEAQCLQANGEALPFTNNAFQKIIIAFGLRNITYKEKALAEMHRVLAPGGKAMILEFSKAAPCLEKIYDTYSFKILPFLGEKVLQDPDSYRYLAESIRKHPDQENLKKLMETAGFERCQFRNLSAGIVAIHTGYKF